MAWDQTTLSVSPSSVELNGASSFTLSVSYAVLLSSSVRNVRAEVLGQTFSIGTISGTSYTWTPPTSMLSLLSSTSAATIKFTGKPTGASGISVEDEKSCYATVTVPASYKPSAPSSITLTRIDNGVPSSWGVYLANKSKVTVSWGAASGTGVATISGYKIRLASSTIANAPSWTVGNVTNFTPDMNYPAGTHSFTVLAIDSRGREGNTVTKSFTVLPYTAPSIVEHRAERCLQSGAISNTGGYIKAWLRYTFDSISNKNSASATVAWRESGGGNYSAEMPIQQQQDLVFGGTFDPNTVYDVRFTVKDAVNTTATLVVRITALSFVLDFLAGGQGAAFGKVATVPGIVDFAWPMRLDNGFYLEGKTLNGEACVVFSNSSHTPVMAITSGGTLVTSGSIVGNYNLSQLQ